MNEQQINVNELFAKMGIMGWQIDMLQAKLVEKDTELMELKNANTVPIITDEEKSKG